jgi:hypothetical protein
LLQFGATFVTGVEWRMRFDWLAWSNPVAVWWGFLLCVSTANMALWFQLHRHFRRRWFPRTGIAIRIEPMIVLCAVYVFGCAFRSILPRADVQRICLFDTWLSSVLVGRSVATLAEVCFAVQWAIVLRELARLSRADTAYNIASLIVPLILLAEFCSWYAVVTTSYLGNAVENSIWAVTFLLIAIALLRLVNAFRGPMQLAIGIGIAGIAGYLAFLVVVDVPMYFGRWEADLASGKPLLGIVAGLHDLATRWVVTHDIAHWHEELAWMALYFSAAVWSSLGLCTFVLFRDRLPRYCASPAHPRPASARAARQTKSPALLADRRR